MRLKIASLPQPLDKISEWAVYTMIFVLPFSKSLLEITFIIALLAVVARKYILKEPLIEISTINVALIVFLAANLLSFINSGYLALSSRAFFSKSLKFAALFLLVQTILRSEIKIKNFIIIAYLSCITILLDASVQYFITHIDLLHSYPSFQFSHPTITATNAPYPRGFLGLPTASFPFPNDFSAWILIFILPAGIMLFMNKTAIWKRTLLAFVFSMLCFFLVATKTRGAWIGFVVSILLMPFIIKIDIKKKLLIALAVILLFASPLILKTTNARHIMTMTSVSDRNVMWTNGWKIFIKHPVIGNGVNTFFEHYKAVREDEYKGKKGSYAHNCYLQMAADVGLLGLGAFLFFVTSVLIGALKAIMICKDDFLYPLIVGLTLGVVAYLVHSFFDTNLYSLNLSYLFWISIGVLMSLVNLSEGRAAGRSVAPGKRRAM